MRFICFGYMDEKKWDAMSAGERDAMMEECLAYDDMLLKDGHWVGSGAALQSTRTAKTLRWKNGKVVVTDGPFAETKEQLGGFGALEARDMDHAVELMSKHPSVRLGGPFEIRPADEEANARCKVPSTVALASKPETKRFLCLGYMEEAIWEALSTDDQAANMQAILAYDDDLRQNGRWVGSESLPSARTAKTLRWKGGKMMVTDGPFAETKEQLGGVVVLAAKDMNQAVELMSKHPGIRLGVHLEIRPEDEEFAACWEARRQAAKSVAALA